MKGLFAAVHESGFGTELPIPNVRSSVVNGGKADKICSMRVLGILTRSRHRPDSQQFRFRPKTFRRFVWQATVSNPAERNRSCRVAPPARAGLQDIELAMVSQRVSER